MLNQPQSNDQYNFSAQPKVVKPKTKYRQETEQEQENPPRAVYNLMYDKRVVRGNTYAAIVTTSREATQQLRTTKNIMPRNSNQQHVEQNDQEFIPRNISTPPPVEGRSHFGCLTDEYVEILTDKPPVYEKDTQTDFIIDRPPERLFMPKKTGEDRETQIWDGDLFNFDYEVEAILQVLMGKTLEHSRMEVLEEEELRVMRQEQKKYDELKAAEIAEAQRLENEERRQLEENEKRKHQYRLKKEQNLVSHKKLVSRCLAKEYLKNIKSNIFNKLSDQGVFKDALEQDLYHIYLPWTFNQLVYILSDQDEFGQILHEMHDYLAKSLSSFHAKSVQDEMIRRHNKKQEEIRLKKEKEEARRLRIEKRKKEELERKFQDFKVRVEEGFMRRLESKTGIFSGIISDIDAFGKEGLVVGCLGGMFGEILTIISTMEEIKEDENFSSFRSLTFTPDQIYRIIISLLNDTIKDGIVEIGFNENIDEAIASIDENCKLENISSANPNAKPKLEELLKENIRSIYIDTIKKNLSEDVIDLISLALVKVLLFDDNNLQKKLKLVKYSGNYAQGPKLLGMVKMIPNMTELVPSAWHEIKPNPKDKGANKKASKNIPKTINKSGRGLEDSSIKEDSRSTIMDPIEAEFDDRTNVIPLVNEECRVFVNQYVPTMLLRRDILLQISSIHKEVEGREGEVLRKVYQKANELEKIFIANMNDFFIYEYEMY